MHSTHNQCCLTNLLQLVDALVPDAELEDIQDASVNVQRHCWHIVSSEYLSDSTVGVLKRDGDRQLRFQGCSQAGCFAEVIPRPDAQ